jgi:hypothetical protein
MALDDPLPGMVEVPLFAYKHFYNGYKGLRGEAPLKVVGLSNDSGPAR